MSSNRTSASTPSSLTTVAVAAHRSCRKSAAKAIASCSQTLPPLVSVRMNRLGRVTLAGNSRRIVRRSSNAVDLRGANKSAETQANKPTNRGVTGNTNDDVCEARTSNWRTTVSLSSGSGLWDVVGYSTIAWARTQAIASRSRAHNPFPFFKCGFHSHSASASVFIVRIPQDSATVAAIAQPIT